MEVRFLGDRRNAKRDDMLHQGGGKGGGGGGGYIKKCGSLVSREGDVTRAPYGSCGLHQVMVLSLVRLNTSDHLFLYFY